MYKTWFPLTRRWLGFEDAAVTIHPGTIDPAQGTFSARLLVAAPTITGDPLTPFDGRWLRSDELLITTVTLPPERERRSVFCTGAHSHLRRATTPIRHPVFTGRFAWSARLHALDPSTTKGSTWTSSSWS